MRPDRPHTYRTETMNSTELDPDEGRRAPEGVDAQKTAEPADDRKPESSQPTSSASPAGPGRPDSRCRSSQEQGRPSRLNRRSATQKAEPAKAEAGAVPDRRRRARRGPQAGAPDRRRRADQGRHDPDRDQGTIAKGSILIKNGKIKAVGAGVTAPEGVKVIDAAGHGRDAGDHRHPLAHRHAGRRQRGEPVDRARGPGQGRGHRRRRRRSTGRWPAGRPRPGCCTARPTRSAARTP